MIEVVGVEIESDDSVLATAVAKLNLVTGM